MIAGRRPDVHLRLGHACHDLSFRALVVGVLNRTHDSFHDGGRFLSLDAVLRQADQLVTDGADVLEVGCRPGGVGVRPVSADQECVLVTSTVEALHDRFDVPVAVDTTRAVVARAAFASGAVLGNDMSGFRDPEYLPTVVQAGAAVVATHCRLPPGVPDPDPHYDDVVGDVASALVTLARRATRAGLPPESVVLDPGLDLGKTSQQSVALLAAVDVVAALGHPVLLAVSNKIFLSRLLGLDQGERTVATAAACMAGVLHGARLLRVHDAALGRQVAALAEALLIEDAARTRS
jgi:dihydropteroate synthase